jgi:hypothetical protein
VEPLARVLLAEPMDTGAIRFFREALEKLGTPEARQAIEEFQARP